MKIGIPVRLVRNQSAKVFKKLQRLKMDLEVHRYKSLVAFSPIRSGSTVVYNLLKMGRSGFDPYKTHNFRQDPSAFFVITIRHPYDSVISSILRYGEEINEFSTIKALNEYCANGGFDALNVETADKNIILIKYEDFFNNMDYLFDALEGRAIRRMPDKSKAIIQKKLAIESIVKKVSRFSDFSEYDHKTHFHGNHISERRGKSHREHLEDSILEILDSSEVLQAVIK